MCGIAGLYIRDPSLIRSHKGLELFVDSLAVSMEERGKDATGMVAVDFDGKAVMDKAAVPAHEFIMDREMLPENTKMVMVHTRAKTKGDPSNYLNNHPVQHKSCFAIHNGSISNDDALFEEHKLERFAEVDSEIIPAMLYETNFELDKMIAAFQAMEGGCATAVLDPLRHPGKLVLCKTHTSPLLVYDAGKFVMFASTYEAMRDAWGFTLGTPPGKKKFIDVSYRKMLIVTDEGITEHEVPYINKVTPQTSMYEHAGYGATKTPMATTTGSTRASGPMENGNGSRPGVGFVESVIRDYEIRDRVHFVRAQRQGTATLLHADTSINGTFRRCEVCCAMVLKEDMRHSIKGQLCCDCKDAYHHLLDQKQGRGAEGNSTTGSENGESFDFSKLKGLFSQSQKDGINTWAADDDWVHESVLQGISRSVGMDTEAIEFLLFRIDETIANRISSVKKFREDMHPIYKESYLEAWHDSDPDKELEYVDILDPPVEHPLKMKALPAPPTGSLALLHDILPLKKAGKCQFCKGKAKRQTALGKSFVNYCNNHFAKCSNIGCDSQANHTRHDGIRVCHQHARGLKECYSNKTLELAGYIVGGNPL